MDISLKESEKENDNITCGGACSLKDRKKIKNQKGEDFKSFGSFHSDPIIELINREKALLKKEIEEKKLIKEYNNNRNKNIQNDEISFLNKLDLIDLDNYEEFKKLFMHDENTIYLNHAAFGSPFLYSYNYAENIRKKVELNPVKFFDRDLFPYLTKVIVKLAYFINCEPNNLMPLLNATCGLNSIIRGLKNEIKKIVFFDITYSSTILIIEEFLKIDENQANFEIIKIPLKYLKTENTEDLINYIIESIPIDTDLLILDHISSQSCILLPIKEIIYSVRQKFTKIHNEEKEGINSDNKFKKEIIILVDGAHAPGSLKLNISELNADFYVGNLHKWFCNPRGAGFIFIDDKYINMVKGAIVSHGHSNKSNFMDSFYWDGNRDYSGFISILKTLEIWEILEKKNIYDFLKNKLKIFTKFLCEKLNVDILFSVEKWNSTMAFIPLPSKYQNFTSKSIQDWLHHEHKVEITIKNVYQKNCMRLSVHLYNSIKEIEKLVDILLNHDLIF